MASIKVKFRPSTITGHEGTIYYQILHERKLRQISTDYKILSEEWDDKCGQVKTKMESPRMSQLLSIRDHIRCDVERLTRINRNLVLKGLSYTTDDIIEEFQRYNEEYSLFNFMKKIIINQKQNGKIRTSETYISAINSFKKYLGSQTCDDNNCIKDDIMMDSITSEVMEGYEAWLKARGLMQNSISFYTRVLRAVYNRAVEDGIIENRNPFRKVYTGVDKTIKRALPLDIIKKMSELDLSMSPTLDYARDMFLLSFYLRGMSFVDMSFLKKSDLKNGCVTYRRRKTGQQLIIRWEPEMQAILDKYTENTTEYLLPILTVDSLNKRSAYRNRAYSINRNLKKIAKMVGVTVPVTLYVARHSWASAAKVKGIPLSVISEGMGHDSETTTQIYLASLDSSIVDKANSLILSSLKEQTKRQRKGKNLI